MNLEPLFHSLQSFPEALTGAVVNLSDDDARWRPADGAWSILEIVTHLADEEALDFKVRLRLTLEDPEQDWPGIDPEGWASQRRYNEGRLRNSLARFAAERAASIDWLRSLGQPDVSRAKVHPKLGSLAAGDLLAAWTAHDWFHLRQIAKRRIQLVERDAVPHSIGYAGGKL